MQSRGFEIIEKYKNCALSLPCRQTQASAGYDLAAAEDIRIPAGEMRIVPTGMKAYMQSDEVLELYIRSSMGIKKRLFLANTVGIIDADYYGNTENEGHIMLAILNMGKEDVEISKGERIAQGIFKKYLRVENEAPPKAMRGGGFGSTGR